MGRPRRQDGPGKANVTCKANDALDLDGRSLIDRVPEPGVEPELGHEQQVHGRARVGVRVASALNLLSVVAALGAITAVFTRGWGGSLLGLSGTGPVDAFLPVVMFSVLFGLSMDYEVYTVSRMHEEWRRLHRESAKITGRADESLDSHRRAIWRNHRAVTAGQAHSTRIVTAAAGIMILVFGSFLPGGHHLLQEFGFGLGFSVLIDALLIRSMLLPAVMHLIGPANWYLPARLARVLPRLDIEAAETGRPGETEVSVPGASEAADPSRTR